jgi:hypothetical protein
MPCFLSDIDSKFNEILGQKTITKKDLINLKSFIIDVYENDNVIEVKSIYKSMRKIEIEN